MKTQIQGFSTTKAKNEQLLDRRAELSSIIEDSKQILDEINAELLLRCKAHDGELVINDHSVKVVERLSFIAVPLEFAKKFRAVKKVVDGDVLKPLYKKGIEMPGVKISEYIYVK